MRSKRGQITIFIILGIMIVIAGALIYMFYPQIQATFGFRVQNPYSFLQDCVGEEVLNSVQILSLQGGSIDPGFSYSYKGQDIEYLCYTNEDYKTCTMQQPFLKEHIESEIENNIKEELSICFDELQRSYESQGYDVVLRKGEFNVELLPKRILINSLSTISLQKDETENYNSFSISLNNNLYELVAIATSIINWEAHFGDAEITTYMNYYRDLKVEKHKQTDGTTIYMLTDLNTEDKFQFASRSLVWPAGYGG